MITKTKNKIGEKMLSEMKSRILSGKKKIRITGIAALFLILFLVPQICIGALYDITKGTNFEFDAVDGDFPALAQIDATHYLCVYQGDGGDGYAVVLTVSGTTITKGTAFEYDELNGNTPALAQIDATHYLCVYQGDGGDGYAVVLTVSGTTITKGAAYEYDELNGLDPALAQIDATHYLCTYKSSDDNYGYAVILIVAGDWTITKGTRLTMDWEGQRETNSKALVKIDNTRYLCAFTQMGMGKHWAMVLTVNTGAGTITQGTYFQFATDCY